MDNESQEAKFIRAVPGTQNLLEGQFGQPVHNVITNALRQPQTKKQAQKPAEGQKKLN